MMLKTVGVTGDSLLTIVFPTLFKIERMGHPVVFPWPDKGGFLDVHDVGFFALGYFFEAADFFVEHGLDFVLGALFFVLA